jgi:uncharacterized protein (TIGR02599 family)
MPLFIRHRRPQARDLGFTLVELIVGMAVLLLILGTLAQFMSNVDQAWKSASTDPFIEAQDAFETVAQNLAGATLAPYQDYADSNGAFRTSVSFVPDHLARRSDLAFVCGPCAGANGLLSSSGHITSGSGVFFVAPNGYSQSTSYSGMERLLNAMGYFVEFGDDLSAPPFVLLQSHSWRWRLKQILQPAESLQIFTNNTSAAWLQGIVPSGTFIPILADNVITLVVLPERAANDSGPELAPAFSYDSRDTSNALTLHQLPSRVRLVLVAIDETSAQRLAAQNGSNPPQLVSGTLFQQADLLDSDLTALDNSLTVQKIGHRLFQREILLPSSSWSNTSSP